jgi:PAS domain-containing protein
LAYRWAVGLGQLPFFIEYFKQSGLFDGGWRRTTRRSAATIKTRRRSSRSGTTRCGAAIGANKFGSARRAMLEGLSEPVRACHERALEAKCKADETSDPVLKASYLDMERRWLFLARSYGFTESLNNFTSANAAWRSDFDGKIVHQKPDSFLERASASELLNLLPVAIYVCEPSGLILYYNETAAQLWGRAP